MIGGRVILVLTNFHHMWLPQCSIFTLTSTSGNSSVKEAMTKSLPEFSLFGSKKSSVPRVAWCTLIYQYGDDNYDTD